VGNNPKKISNYRILVVLKKNRIYFHKGNNIYFEIKNIDQRPVTKTEMMFSLAQLKAQPSAFQDPFHSWEPLVRMTTLGEKLGVRPFLENQILVSSSGF
jgi:hypothetical protein